MSRLWSLAYLTGNGADPLEAIAIAAEAGYQAISFRLLPATTTDRLPPLIDDVAQRRGVMASLAQNGIAFLDAEMIRIPEGGAELVRYVPFLDCLAEMGARHINVVFAETDRARSIDTFGRLCEMADTRGLTADLEFMPWTGVKTLAEARDIVEAAGHPAGAILFDCLHFDRTGAPMDQLAALPPGALNYVQICDGPAEWLNTDEDLIRIARTARLIPGEGGVDLPGIAGRLPPGIAVSVEVPNHALAERIGRTELARKALIATKALFNDGTTA